MNLKFDWRDIFPDQTSFNILHNDLIDIAMRKQGRRGTQTG